VETNKFSDGETRIRDYGLQAWQTVITSIERLQGREGMLRPGRRKAETVNGRLREWYT
jgi:hypothetical protein